MDVLAVKITLHPMAKDALFKDYQALRYIFSNVLGLVETDYLSIALIDEQGRILFFSSHPSIELNLIEKNLWSFDGCFNPNFIYQDEMHSWDSLYPPEYKSKLFRYKQSSHQLRTGFSIPTDFEEFRVVFSFGFKSSNPFLHYQIPKQREKLIAMGNYCLREIIRVIGLPLRKHRHLLKPHLELIINNEVNHENINREG
ncbi:TPA: flagellar biosynthesis protein FlgJ [Legionella pneumophila]|nr:flagellar biosynthesis protein FlgJ [Legionella pneumophila]